MSQQLMSQILRRLAPPVPPRPKGQKNKGWHGLVLGFTWLMVGCTPTVAIGELKQQPASSLNGRSVYIQGKAVERVPLLDGRIYRIEDPTGWIWVLSQGDRTELELGQVVKLKASLRYQPIQVGQQEMGELYAIEEP